MEVTLNIYDINVQMNPYLSALGIGIFHSGIEIGGIEFQYSRSLGVIEVEPRTAGPEMPLNRSITLGLFTGNMSEVDDIVTGLRRSYSRFNYNISKRNCNDFSNSLAIRLKQKPLPRWINRAAAVGKIMGISAKSEEKQDPKHYSGWLRWCVTDTSEDTSNPGEITINQPDTTLRGEISDSFDDNPYHIEMRTAGEEQSIEKRNSPIYQVSKRWKPPHVRALEDAAEEKCCLPHKSSFKSIGGSHLTSQQRNSQQGAAKH